MARVQYLEDFNFLFALNEEKKPLVWLEDYIPAPL